MENKLFDIKYMDLELKVDEKFEAIKYLANLAQDRLLDVDNYIEDVKQREAICETVIGNIAIPHAKSKWVKELTIIVGRKKSGLGWSMKQEINTIFLIAVPESLVDEHVNILKKLAISLANDNFIKKIRNIRHKRKLKKMLLNNIC